MSTPATRETMQCRVFLQARVDKNSKLAKGKANNSLNPGPLAYKKCQKIRENQRDRSYMGHSISNAPCET